MKNKDHIEEWFVDLDSGCRFSKAVNKLLCCFSDVKHFFIVFFISSISPKGRRKNHPRV